MSDEVSIPPAPSYRVPLQLRRRHDPARRMRLMVAGSLGAVVFAWFAGSMWFDGGSAERSTGRGEIETAIAVREHLDGMRDGDVANFGGAGSRRPDELH